MAFRIVVEARARGDIEEIYEFIARDSDAAALRWYERLLKRLESLRHAPARCAFAPEEALLRIELRQLWFGAFRILFTLDDERERVHVLHIRHGARRTFRGGEL